MGVSLDMANRDYSISFIRLLSMFLIITCHILQYYDNGLAWVLNVGVQVFLIISGYLYGLKKIDSCFRFLIKQFKKILIPYWIFLFVATALYYIFSPENINIKIFVKSLLTISTINGIGHLWFIRYILLCYCLLPLLNIIRDRISGGVIMALAAIPTMFFVHLLIEPISYFNGAFINCFVFGYFLCNIERRLEHKAFNVISTIVVLVAVVINVIRLISIYGDTVIVNDMFNKYAHLLFGALLFILLRRVNLKNYYKPLRLSDKYSYHIYIVHQLFILSPFTVLTLTNIKVVDILLVYVVCCLFGYILYVVSNYISDTIFTKHMVAS